MGVDLHGTLLVGASVRQRQGDGRTFAQRVQAGEFGPFPRGGDLEEFFVAKAGAFPFEVRAAQDLYVEQERAPAFYVGIPVLEAWNRGEPLGGGLTEQELDARVADATRRLAAHGIDAVDLWFLPGAS